MMITELLKMKCNEEELAEVIQTGEKNGQISATDSKCFVDYYKKDGDYLFSTEQKLI